MKTDVKKIEVRFRDIDAMGHVNNAVYFSYFEQARIQFFGSITGKDWDWNEYGLLIARNEIDYLLPVLLSDEVYIHVFTEKVGGKSFVLSYEVKAHRNGEELLCAKGLSVLVCFDHASQKTIEVPDFWRKALLEG